MTIRRAFHKRLLARASLVLRSAGEFALATLVGVGVTGCSGDTETNEDKIEDASPDKQISYDGGYEVSTNDVLSPDGAPPMFDGMPEATDEQPPCCDGAPPSYDGAMPMADGMPEATTYDGAMPSYDGGMPMFDGGYEAASD